jgi:hypothetical protein
LERQPLLSFLQLDFSRAEMLSSLTLNPHLRLPRWRTRKAKVLRNSVISDSSSDRNSMAVWFRIEILPTHVTWRHASLSSKVSSPPETHQSVSQGQTRPPPPLGVLERLSACTRSRDKLDMQRRSCVRKRILRLLCPAEPAFMCKSLQIGCYLENVTFES